MLDSEIFPTPRRLRKVLSRESESEENMGKKEIGKLGD